MIPAASRKQFGSHPPAWRIAPSRQHGLPEAGQSVPHHGSNLLTRARTDRHNSLAMKRGDWRRHGRGPLNLTEWLFIIPPGMGSRGHWWHGASSWFRRKEKAVLCPQRMGWHCGACCHKTVGLPQDGGAATRVQKEIRLMQGEWGTVARMLHLNWWFFRSGKNKEKESLLVWFVSGFFPPRHSLLSSAGACNSEHWVKTSFHTAQYDRFCVFKSILVYLRDR